VKSHGRIEVLDAQKVFIIMQMRIEDLRLWDTRQDTNYRADHLDIL